LSAPALDAGEARFRLIIERNADGVVVLRDDGRIAYANPAAEALLGRPAEALVGQPFGVPLLAGETTEVDIPHPGGEVRHAELRVVRTEWAGAPALLASLRDITARRRSEAAFRESEERFRLLVEGVRDYGMIMVDPLGRIVSWNSAAERLTGFAEPEAVGRHFRLLFTPEDSADGVPESELAIAARDGRADDERWHARRDGTRFWASGVVTPLYDDDGRLRGFAKVLRDITERRRMEEELRRRADELLEADRQKNNFLAMLAHELRNPLSPVLNALELMKLPDIPPERLAQARAMVEEQVRHMAALVDDLLDVSRITRGKIALKRQRLDLNELLRGAVEAARPLMESHQVELEVLPASEPLPVEADPTRMVQVLANLLNNGAKYTPAGGRVAISARREGEQVEVRVRDNGVGIDARTLPRVFDLFAQADRTLDRTQGGLGIGLTLVRNLVELHGGTVSAHSDGLGRGSEFVVRLPAARQAPGPDGVAARPEPPQQASSPSARKLRVLVVDDNRQSAESLAVLIRHWGHHPCLAFDGDEALEAADRHLPELILLDIGLPKLDGYQVAARLRERPEAADLVIVAMTGYGQDDDRRRALDAGFDIHLVKPVEPKFLRNLLADPGQVRRPAARGPIG
jgi:PAS domain S-box-containing protein